MIFFLETSWILEILVFIISAIPLNLALKIFGAKTNILKTAGIVFLSSIVILFLQMFFGFGGFIAFILMIFIYKFSFKIGWWKSFFAWLLQFVIIAILLLAAIALGLSLILI